LFDQREDIIHVKRSQNNKMIILIVYKLSNLLNLKNNTKLIQIIIKHKLKNIGIIPNVKIISNHEELKMPAKINTTKLIQDYLRKKNLYLIH